MRAVEIGALEETESAGGSSRSSMVAWDVVSIYGLVDWV